MGLIRGGVPKLSPTQKRCSYRPFGEILLHIWIDLGRLNTIPTKIFYESAISVEKQQVGLIRNPFRPILGLIREGGL
jgi:hypothetical protein